MPIDPAAIRAQEFRVVFRGYDVEEVDAFLDWIEQELSRPAQGPDAPSPAEPAYGAAYAQAMRTLRHAEQAAERMLAEAAADAAAVRERAHAEARGIVADARADAVHIVATTPRRPSADVEDLVVRAERLRAELDRLGASERRCREQLQTWLEGHGRLFDRGPVPATSEVPADPLRRDPGTTVRRVLTTLPTSAAR